MYTESGSPPGDQPVKKDAQPKKADGGVKEWNVVSSVGKIEQALPLEELAERARIAKPQGGVGCGFDQVPTKEAVKDWYNNLSKEEKAALQDPLTVVSLTALASLVGTRDYNDKLTQRRGDAVKETLKKELGVKADIKIDPMGFSIAEGLHAPPNKDNHRDRVVYIDIIKVNKGEAPVQPAGEKPPAIETQPPTGQAQPSGEKPPAIETRPPIGQAQPAGEKPPATETDPEKSGAPEVHLHKNHHIDQALKDFNHGIL